MFLARHAAAQVSPGPLAKPHQDLDSPMKCLSCHGQGSDAGMHDRCLACHQEISWLIAHRAGLHPRESQDDCTKCHPDHKGLDAPMVRWEEGGPEKFDHTRTGWRLDGRHARLKCRECHKTALQRSESAPLIRRREKEASWVGLDRACGSCHEAQDIHRGALRDCGRCHDPRAWKPAPSFDHRRSDFPLTGGHARVSCAKCHMAPTLRLAADPAGRPVPLYKPLPHGDCSSCHHDPHGGKFGTGCARCHATDSWKNVDKRAFQHNLTRYPLQGRHASVRCEQCHDPRAAWEKKTPFAACGTCHRDPHAGQATLPGTALDCGSCHQVEGFRPSTFTVARHAASRFPLNGAHARVRCEICHRKNPAGIPPETLGKAGVALRIAYARCRDCHEDSHAGQLTRSASQGACEACHKVDGWKPSTFSPAAHAGLRFPLEGRHAKVPCAVCHGPARTGLPELPGAERLGRAAVALRLQETACTACHLDPHEGRFSLGGARPKTRSCRTCHNLESFRPSTVDVALHRGFTYPLEGAHRAVPCSGCHRESAAPPVKSSLLLARSQAFRLPFVRESRCDSCHRNPHGSQFARREDGGACEGCHAVEGFRPAARFDHNRDSAFPLGGAHARLACARCHSPRAAGTAQVLVIYRPLPHQCRDCHAGKQSQRQARSQEVGPRSDRLPAPGGGA